MSADSAPVVEEEAPSAPGLEAEGMDESTPMEVGEDRSDAEVEEEPDIDWMAQSEEGAYGRSATRRKRSKDRDGEYGDL